MTGQGHASEDADVGMVRVEVRTVNNRGLKISPRLSDSIAVLEPKIESLVRSNMKRGTVQISVKLHLPAAQNAMQIDQSVLKAYIDQLNAARDASVDHSLTIELSNLLGLPGVMTGSHQAADEAKVWPLVKQTILAAIGNLNQMRRAEGAAMAGTLLDECEGISERVAQIETLVPRAATKYAERLEGKIQRILAERNLEQQPIDILREVQIFADRSDVSEEVTRLGSHLQMFRDVITGKYESDQADSAPVSEPVGRKLDFIVQEMFRETNTTGSKAADPEVSAHVVEIKCALERIRELVQNLE